MGPSLSEERAKAREAEDGWHVKLDGKRGWRRVVSSPKPVKVIQRHMIREAAHRGHIVIAAGGHPGAGTTPGDYVVAFSLE